MSVWSTIGDIGKTAANAASGGIVGNVISDIFGNSQSDINERARQFAKEQQERQISGAKELADYNQMIQMQNYDATNYENQMEHIKAAGLNPAMLYGKGGGSGATMGGGGMGMPTAGTAPDQSAGTRNAMDIAMMGAQMTLMQAQAAKTKAETDKIQGADTENTGQQTAESKSRQAGIDFQNAVNKAVGIDEETLTKHRQNDVEILKGEKANADWEFEKQLKYGENGEVRNEQNPYMKQMRAEMELTKQALKNAKITNNIAEATEAIEKFKAKMVSNGISPDSPWYVKMLVDMAQQAGIKKSMKDTVSNPHPTGGF